MVYAKTTKVPVSRTRDEIERTLERYGADQFFYGSEATRVLLGFRIASRTVRIVVPMPEDPQENRARWRALLLVLKAKLEAVESGISTIEREFLADVLLPDGTTIGDWMRPQLEAVYEHGTMPALLPGTP